MSLITRCPACETLFKVVPDQLRMSEGWARCGQCSEVFDASLHLLQNETEPWMPAVQPGRGTVRSRVNPSTGPAPTPSHPAEAAPSAEPLVRPDIASSIVVPEPEPKPEPKPESEPDPELISGPESKSAPETPPELTPESEPNPEPDTEPELKPEAIPEPGSESATENTLEPETDAVPATSWPDIRFTPIGGASAEHAVAGDAGEFSFTGRQRRAAYWRRPAVRLALALLSGVLLLVLGAQVVFHERNRLAATHPNLKPWLVAMCAPLNCTVAPLQQIESLVIDSASFVKLRGDVYRLNFTVKNTAALALALPAVELTLTDLRDQPVLRRVFLPAELGVRQDTLGPGADWPASIVVTVKAGGVSDHFVGYRLLAFYP